MSEVSYIANPELNVKLSASKQETVTYNSLNPLPGGSSEGNYKIRDTTTKYLSLPHLSQGIFEQAIIFNNELDAEVKIVVSDSFRQSGVLKSGAGLIAITIPAGGRAFIYSDKSPSVNDTRMYSLVELRLPMDRFALNITATTAPTSGELHIISNRRY